MYERLRRNQDEDLLPDDDEMIDFKLFSTEYVTHMDISM